MPNLPSSRYNDADFLSLSLSSMSFLLSSIWLLCSFSPSAILFVSRTSAHRACGQLIIKFQTDLTCLSSSHSLSPSYSLSLSLIFTLSLSFSFLLSLFLLLTLSLSPSFHLTPFYSLPLFVSNLIISFSFFLCLLIILFTSFFIFLSVYLSFIFYRL